MKAGVKWPRKSVMGFFTYMKRMDKREFPEGMK